MYGVFKPGGLASQNDARVSEKLYVVVTGSRVRKSRMFLILSLRRCRWSSDLG